MVALTLIATACTGGGGKDSSGGVVEEEQEAVGPTGPQTYTVSMDAPSPEGQKVMVAAAFPVKVKVRPGDTVVFENRSTEGPHTVTMGASPLDPEPIPLMTKAGAPNPAIFGPCFSETAPGAGSEACPSPVPATTPPFAGAGYWNSGVLPPYSGTGAPPTFTMQIADTIAADTYTYSCYLHRYMSGQLEVVEQDIDRDKPADVAETIERHRALALKMAGQFKEPVSANAATTVAAGWGDKVSAINRFSPAVTKVKVGEKVMWTASSEFEPHTITFESPFKSPEEPGVFTPAGVKSGARYTGGFAHSGLIGPKPFAADSFSLVFGKPGTYSYVCVLHPGMAGQVEVTG
jgi:plastocyanin